MASESKLRQTAIDALHVELRKRRPGKVRSEIALAVLSEMRETAEDKQPPEWVQQLLAETAIENERERKFRGRE